MESRRILSIAMIILGIVSFLILGLGVGEWLLGAVLGLVFLVVGIIFYRRGK